MSDQLKLIIAFFILFVCGCATIGRLGPAGAVWSRKPFTIPRGTVTQASPKVVKTVWPKEDWFYGSGNNLYLGNVITNVCPATVPAKGSHHAGVRLTWQPASKCWQWQEVRNGR